MARLSGAALDDWLRAHGTIRLSMTSWTDEMTGTQRINDLLDHSVFSIDPDYGSCKMTIRPDEIRVLSIYAKGHGTCKIGGKRAYYVLTNQIRKK